MNTLTEFITRRKEKNGEEEGVCMAAFNYLANHLNNMLISNVYPLFCWKRKKVPTFACSWQRKGGERGVADFFAYSNNFRNVEQNHFISVSCFACWLGFFLSLSPFVRFELSSPISSYAFHHTSIWAHHFFAWKIRIIHRISASRRLHQQKIRVCIHCTSTDCLCLFFSRFACLPVWCFSYGIVCSVCVSKFITDIAVSDVRF